MPSFSGDRLRGHRNGLGRGLADVAEKVGCTVEELESFEAARGEPTPELLAAIAAELGQPIRELHARNSVGQDDYMDAVLSHADPLSDDDLRSIALVMRRKPNAA
ncbi:MAG TPA: helix-turn-helix transcriptional regulator [Pseudonocardia sp.]|uniref:helix-turn-helix domain-containing protein n=1 Tax=Pseudonocardia sp. TaxID=60912 RepID=UPI002BCA537D|nr:helix-turn-helix transcriptional regulator [Pseudonocardia sp.]HTF52206.1 helix-turn-helix transcriptional regulator [Pseudonocardia sp.]